MGLLVFGPVAQLGERLVRNEEVGGSNPPRSTPISFPRRFCIFRSALSNLASGVKCCGSGSPLSIALLET